MAILEKGQYTGVDKDALTREGLSIQKALDSLVQLTYDGANTDAEHEMSYLTRTFVIEKYKDYRTYIEPMQQKVALALENMSRLQPDTKP